MQVFVDFQFRHSCLISLVFRPPSEQEPNCHIRNTPQILSLLRSILLSYSLTIKWLVLVFYRQRSLQ